MEQIQDPRQIPLIDLPIHIVLSNQATDFVSLLIDWKTRSNYCHAMCSINIGKFICQNFGGYNEIPMDGYLRKGGQLKFIKLINANDDFNRAFRVSIINRLKRPWFMKMYDFGNIFGRAIGLPWVHIPGTFDCSEVTLYHLKQASTYLPLKEATLIRNISDRASPQDLDAFVQLHPEIFSIYGHWQADEGVVV